MGAWVVGFALAGHIAVAWYLLGGRARRMRNRRPPFTDDFLRTPGQTLREEIQALNDKISGELLTFTAVPVMVVVGWLLQRHIPADWQAGGWAASLAIAAGLLAYWAFAARKLTGHLKRRHNCQLGMEAEIAVGQSLDQLMLKKARVFHDFPADGFNIDHVVVARHCVFAVETKGRMKPAPGATRHEAKIYVEKHQLQFPGWTERQPIEQAARQAEWLHAFIKRTVGHDVPVRAVVAVPGWYIVNREWGKVIVSNLKNPGFLVDARTGGTMPDDLMARVVSRIEEQCRNVGSSLEEAKDLPRPRRNRGDGSVRYTIPAHEHPRTAPVPRR